MNKAALAIVLMLAALQVCSAARVKVVLANGQTADWAALLLASDDGLQGPEPVVDGPGRGLLGELDAAMGGASGAYGYYGYYDSPPSLPGYYDSPPSPPGYYSPPGPGGYYSPPGPWGVYGSDVDTMP